MRLNTSTRCPKCTKPVKIEYRWDTLTTYAGTEEDLATLPVDRPEGPQMDSGADYCPFCQTPLRIGMILADSMDHCILTIGTEQDVKDYEMYLFENGITISSTLMSEVQVYTEYEKHVIEGVKCTLEEWEQKWAPNEKRIRVTVTNGKDGPDCCLTYGTLKEHKRHFKEWSEGMSDQGYRCSDITEMRPSTLDEITYEANAKDNEANPSEKADGLHSEIAAARVQ
jgi:hypothetical protein